MFAPVYPVPMDTVGVVSVHTTQCLGPTPCRYCSDPAQWECIPLFLAAIYNSVKPWSPSSQPSLVLRTMSIKSHTTCFLAAKKRTNFRS